MLEIHETIFQKIKNNFNLTNDIDISNIEIKPQMSIINNFKSKIFNIFKIDQNV